MGCQLLLITNRKSYTASDWCRLRWPWMTLNAVITRITKFDRFSGQLCHSGWR